MKFAERERSKFARALASHLMLSDPDKGKVRSTAALDEGALLY